MKEERQFKINTASMLYHTVMSQTGSFAKAIMELVMNGIDAQATEIIIDLDPRRYSVKDNGKGMQTETEIEEYFDTFAFNHDTPNGQRLFGRFGIGRGQQWRWADSTYRTGTFEMEVLIDHSTKTLKYNMTRNLPQVQGTIIEGKFKTPLKASEYAECLKTIAELTKYSIVTIKLNSQRINTPPDTLKWTHETEEAYILTNETGSLKVYNMGMLVGTFHGYGSGIVVTKMGHTIELNMSRNDIMRDDPIWKRIKDKFQSITQERIKRNTTHTENDLQMFCKGMHDGEADFNTFLNLKLFTTTTNSNLLPAMFLGHLKRSKSLMMHDQSVRHSNCAAHEKGLITVLHPRTLERFGVNNLTELKTVLVQYLNSQKRQVKPNSYQEQFLMEFIDLLMQATIHQDIKSANLTYLEQFVTKSKLIEREKIMLSALHKVASTFQTAAAYTLSEMEIPNKYLSIDFGVGQAEAEIIWIERTPYGIKLIIEERRIRDALHDSNALMNLINSIALAVLNHHLEQPEAAECGKNLSEIMTTYFTKHARTGRTFATVLRLMGEGYAKKHKTPQKKLLKSLDDIGMEETEPAFMTGASA